MQDINLLAVLAAAVASMIIGSIWYGPLFGKQFNAIMGFDKMSTQQQAEMKKGMAKMYFTQLVASLVMFYVLAMLMYRLGEMTVQGGLMVAFWVWLGFVVPTKLGDAIWGGKMSLFWIGIGNMLATLLAVGAILGAWR
jgi:hypothetical protein